MTRLIVSHRNRLPEALAIVALGFVLALVFGFGRPGFNARASAPVAHEAGFTR